MNLKDFIKETITGIVEATDELQAAHEKRGVVINPPVTVQERDLYKHDDMRHTYRRVETVEFDVAVTAASEKDGGGKVGLRVFSAEAGIDGKVVRRNEEVSRVRFSIPVVFSPSDVEARNCASAAEHARAVDEDRRRYDQEDSWIKPR